MTDVDAAAFWARRYGERDRMWSGAPNHALVSAVGALHPGRALDLGCGEGADSVWLAEQGWQVTAVDIAANAVGRARQLADDRDVPAGRIRWLVTDLGTWRPRDRYDLVSACFLHSPLEFPRTDVLRRVATVVEPGGHLLIVGHAAPPPWAQAHDHRGHRFATPAEEVEKLELEAARWDVVISDIRPRDAVGPNGEHAVLDDTVVLARRRSNGS
jgi:SAM-dependent methyltransferase